MKKTVFVLFAFFGFVFSLTSAPVDNLRKIFHESVLHKEKLPLFIKQIQSIQNPTAIEKAYIGASEALKARETWNPIEKLAYIQKFREYLLEAIETDAENLEIRFIRFSIEYNIPSLLQSKKAISEDKSKIISNLSQLEMFNVDESFVRYILRLFEDTKTCTETEIEMIKSKLKS